MLREEDWGKGFATEIARRLIEYGFGELNLPEIFATVDDENLASHRVLEKAGMNFKEYEYDEDGRFSVYSIKSEGRLSPSHTKQGFNIEIMEVLFSLSLFLSIYLRF